MIPGSGGSPGDPVTVTNNSIVNINDDHLNEVKETIYSQFDIARESATITCILSEIQTQAEKQESFTVKKRGDISFVLFGGC